MKLRATMLSLFQRKKVVPTAAPATAPQPPGEYLPPASATTLLATPRRQKLLDHIWQRTSLSRSQFAVMYRAPIERYAALVQAFPASESHHHAQHGGMLDHGLEIVAYALKLRQSHLLPASAPPEVQSAQAEAWTAGLAYGALLHDLGKIAVDLDVELADGSPWHPWHGPLKQPYRFRYRKDRSYRLHNAATGLLYMQVLDASILDWLSTFRELWSALLHVLAGHAEHAGMLGELVARADQASVAQDLGGNPQRALAAPKPALQRKLLDGLRHLVRNELKLNQPEASDGWLTADALWLVSKTVADKLRAHLLAQGAEGIPTKNTTVFDVLQEHGIVQATGDGKAIWRAQIRSQNGWSNTFTFLRLTPAVIWNALDDRPAAFAGTVTPIDEEPPGATDDAVATGHASSTAASPTPTPAASLEPKADGLEAVWKGLPFDAPASPEPPDTERLHGKEMPTLRSETSMGSPTFVRNAVDPPDAQPSGEHFIAWLKQGIPSRKLIINDAKALVHTVAGTAYLVSPGLFQRYAQEFPAVNRLARSEKVEGWTWTQKRFEQLHLHRKQAQGLNIWTCEVTGPRKSRRLHGYLLKDAQLLFADTPADNPYLTLIP